jgi:hypothetical protein
MFCLTVLGVLAASMYMKLLLAAVRQCSRWIQISLAVLLTALVLTPVAIGLATVFESSLTAWVIAVFAMSATIVASEARTIPQPPPAPTTQGRLGPRRLFVAMDPLEVWGRIPDLFCAWNIVSAANKVPPCTFEGAFGPIAGYPGSFYPTPEQLLKPAAKGRIRYVANGRWVDAPFILPKPTSGELYTFSDEDCPPVPQCTSEQEWLFVLGITNAMVNQVHETRARKRAIAAKRAIAEVLAQEGTPMVL